MTEKVACSCGAGPTIFLACSGASDVGQIADLAARRLRDEGVGKMSCLIGIASGVTDIIDKVRAAGKLLVIDGCSTECGKRTLQQADFSGYLHLRIEDLGMEKNKTPVTEERITEVLLRAGQMLA